MSTSKSTKKGAGNGMPQDLSAFLTRLGKGGEWQYYVEFKEKPEEGIRNIKWFRVGDIPNLPEWRAVFFNVHPQVMKLESHQRGKTENVSVINHLFAEFDIKDGWTAEKVYALCPRPSIIIFSGGGWHCYWLLKEPILVTETNREEMRRLQAGWVEIMGGDKASKDLARVLRVPYSFNNKYEEPKQVEFLDTNYDLEYSLDELALIIRSVEIEKERINRQSQYADLESDPSLYTPILEALGKLNKKRADSYEDTLTVGMALHDAFKGSPEGLSLWDVWARQSVEKYEPGWCAKKWESFNTDRDIKVTVNSLFHMAKEDSGGTFIKPGKKGAKPSELMEAVHAMGYRFSKNEMNDRIYVNGGLMTTGIESIIMTNLREYGYKDKNTFGDAFIAEAEENSFHPIREYLTHLEWDGIDRISIIDQYIKDEHGIFPKVLRKWMIGAVSRVMSHSFMAAAKEQNPMMVLVGPQWLGKSVFAAWVGSPLPDLFMKGPIQVDNKDHEILAVSKFIWEVEELDGTIGRADRAKLKGHLNRSHHTIRPPYARHDITKPKTVSYIGTVNHDGTGFLDDPTGNRRYRTVHLTWMDFHIDEDGNRHYGYEENIDINQLWAQAVAHHKAGETYALDRETEQKLLAINKEYSRVDAMTPYIEELFEINPEQKDWFVTTRTIVESLNTMTAVKGLTDNFDQKRIAGIMTSLGARSGQKRIGSRVVRGWHNVTPIHPDSIAKDVAEKSKLGGGEEINMGT